MAEKDPKPGPSPKTAELRKLYREIGELIVLTEAQSSRRIMLLGDIEVPWPPSVNDEVARRIKTKTAAIEARMSALKHGKQVD